ncbi:MAG: hypothetical protein LBJ10_07075, partial [Clostridiales bacterium]|nr:hypothetical protein [Clostridiales bacterium]
MRPIEISALVPQLREHATALSHARKPGAGGTRGGTTVSCHAGDACIVAIDKSSFGYLSLATCAPLATSYMGSPVLFKSLAPMAINNKVEIRLPINNVAHDGRFYS